MWVYVISVVAARTEQLYYRWVKQLATSEYADELVVLAGGEAGLRSAEGLARRQSKKAQQAKLYAEGPVARQTKKSRQAKRYAEDPVARKESACAMCPLRYAVCGSGAGASISSGGGGGARRKRPGVVTRRRDVT